MALKLCVTVDLCMTYMFMFVSMTLSLTLKTFVRLVLLVCVFYFLQFFVLSPLMQIQIDLHGKGTADARAVLFSPTCVCNDVYVFTYSDAMETI